jgi:HD-GYP domain-containing protein (c-di-GMP phosphodiesterase class II)
VLVRVAAGLKQLVRPPAVYGRFGGDEFVAAFPGVAAAGAGAVMERLREAVGAIEVINGAHIALPMRMSCGLAVYRGEETPRELIADAEEQMYLDKSISPALMGNMVEMTIPGGRVKVSNLKALRNLVRAIDRRDSYTRFHSDHATQLAVDLARHVALEMDQTNAITIAGPIHDLGKIVVPDEVLRKPGPLTAEERRTMEEHPVIGAAITAAVTDYDAVVDLVRHHHERFDGEGYPGRLRGDRISMPTRVFAVADAYSAMTTDRPYRRALTLEQALAQIVAGRGSQFDPDLGLAFVNLMEHRYPDREDAA